MSELGNKTNIFSQNKQGFTLVELIVSVGLFVTVALIASSSLMVLISTNARVQQLSTAVSNFSFALDTMTRNIRTGFDYTCSTDGDPFAGVQSNCFNGNTLGYTDGRTGVRVGYRYNSSSMRLEVNEGDTEWLPLTSSEIKITNFIFFVDGTTSGTDQPRVFIRALGRVEGNNDNANDFEIQAFVTQRLLDL